MAVPLALSLLQYDFMPKSPQNPSKRGSNPNIDKGVGDRELEDRVGRRPDEKPEMVPPGQEPETVSRPDEDDDDTREQPDESDDRDEGTSLPGSKVSELDQEAIEADRATARRSDRRDARDGVDPSDSLPFDPDALGGKTY